MSKENGVSENSRLGFYGFVKLIVRNILKIIFVNLLCILFSLPIVTLPSSLTAAAYTLGRISEDAEGAKVFSDFFGFFKRNFFQPLAVMLPTLFALVALCYVTYFYSANELSFGFLSYVGFAFAVILFLLLYISFVFQMCLIAKVNLSVGAVFKNSFTMIFLKPLKSLAVLAVAILSLALQALTFPYSLPVVLSFGISLTVFCEVYLVYPIIKKYILRYDL